MTSGCRASWSGKWRYFERYPDTGLLHHAIVSDVPESIILELSDDRAVGDGAERPRRAFAEIFHADIDVAALTAMVRRDVLDSVGIFDERRELYVEDWDLWLRIAARYPVGFISLPLAIHRPGGHMSSALERTFGGQQLVIEKTAPLCGEAYGTGIMATPTCACENDGTTGIGARL